MMPAHGATLGGVALQTEHVEEPFLLNVDQYHQMIDAGILTEDDKVELLEGRLIAVSAEGPPHDEVRSRLLTFLAQGLDWDRYRVGVGSPMTFAPRSEPEPDFSVIEHGAKSMEHHAAWALVLIEVSHSSLRKDRVAKAPIYAAAGIPEYWIVDLEHWCVEVRTEPKDGAYRRTQTVARDGVVQAQAVALPPLNLADLFAA
jgi:Uma2 family endonuclease